MSNLTNAAAGNGSVAAANAGVTREEHERRLFFGAEKMLDGMSRRVLVEMAMSCFKVARRTAFKYVAIAARRLHHQETGVSPQFYFALSKLQRERLLEAVMLQTRSEEKLDPHLLVELVTAANRVLDSRDRAAVRLFESQVGKNDAPPSARVRFEEVEEDEDSLPELGPLQIEHQPAEPQQAPSAPGTPAEE